MSKTPEQGIVLGQRVRIRDADIEGVVVGITEHHDGTWTYWVRYWHAGERTRIECDKEELEP